MAVARVSSDFTGLVIDEARAARRAHERALGLPGELRVPARILQWDPIERGDQLVGAIENLEGVFREFIRIAGDEDDR